MLFRQEPESIDYFDDIERSYERNASLVLKSGVLKLNIPKFIYYDVVFNENFWTDELKQSLDVNVSFRYDFEKEILKFKTKKIKEFDTIVHKVVNQMKIAKSKNTETQPSSVDPKQLDCAIQDTAEMKSNESVKQEMKDQETVAELKANESVKLEMEHKQPHLIPKQASIVKQEMKVIPKEVSFVKQQEKVETNTKQESEPTKVALAPSKSPEQFFSDSSSEEEISSEEDSTSTFTTSSSEISFTQERIVERKRQISTNPQSIYNTIEVKRFENLSVQNGDFTKRDTQEGATLMNFVAKRERKNDSKTFVQGKMVSNKALFSNNGNTFNGKAFGPLHSLDEEKAMQAFTSKVERFVPTQLKREKQSKPENRSSMFFAIESKESLHMNSAATMNSAITKMQLEAENRLRNPSPVVKTVRRKEQPIVDAQGYSSWAPPAVKSQNHSAKPSVIYQKRAPVAKVSRAQEKRSSVIFHPSNVGYSEMESIPHTYNQGHIQRKTTHSRVIDTQNPVIYHESEPSSGQGLIHRATTHTHVVNPQNPAAYQKSREHRASYYPDQMEQPIPLNYPIQNQMMMEQQYAQMQPQIMYGYPMYSPYGMHVPTYQAAAPYPPPIERPDIQEWMNGHQ